MKISPIDGTAFSPALLSILDELYNQRLPLVYMKWGLLSKTPKEKILIIQNNQPILQEKALSPSFSRRIIASAIFPFRVSKLIAQYDPSVVDEYFSKELHANLRKLSYEQKIEKLAHVRDLLLQNMEYSLLANLIIQYRLEHQVPKQFCTDIQAQRYTATYKLAHKKMTKKSFDEEYGFLASEDTDPGCARYYEVKRIQYYGDMVKEHDGGHNFREHVKFRTAKLVTLYRLLLLSLGKKDLLKRIQIQEQASSSFRGKVLSGKGSVRGKVRVLKEGKYSLRKGEIAVVKALSPDVVILFSKAKAIIAETGGMLSHAAIVAREKNIFVLGQVVGASKTLHTGDEVFIEKDTIELLKKRRRTR